MTEKKDESKPLTIKEKLKKLTPEQRKELLDAQELNDNETISLLEQEIAELKKSGTGDNKREKDIFDILFDKDEK